MKTSVIKIGQLVHLRMLALVIVGLILLSGVIWMSEDINAILVDDQTAIAATMPSPETIAPTTPSSPTTIPTDPLTDDAIPSPDQTVSIINDPLNYRVVPKDILPAQAFIEGKTTKFLMGF
ncbi:MAG: hypothetical protein WC553_03370 [Patescibacteria group bacterium]|jgi:hypothetical protein